MRNVIFIAIVAILFGGCAQKTDPILKTDKVKVPTDANLTMEKQPVVRQKHYPRPPKKKIKLQKVKDNDFDSSYMYPTETKKSDKKPINVVKSSVGMTKAECISMITQAKFDKYTAMFGSEAASIRRCKMLKAKAQKSS